METRWFDVDGARLHVGVVGTGRDLLVLTGGPGCVQYLEQDELVPSGFRGWHPEPRGVGRSSGGPHGMEQAIADLEELRRAAGVAVWTVLGHSWGCDLALRYAIEHPAAVTAVIGIAGRGFQRDRHWSEAYEAGKAGEPVVDIGWAPDVHASLSASFTEWIHSPSLWSRVATCDVPVQLIAAGDDIRPSWPMEQLAALLPHGAFWTVPGVPHDFWSTHPGEWVATLARALEVRP